MGRGADGVQEWSLQAWRYKDMGSRWRRFRNQMKRKAKMMNTTAEVVNIDQRGNVTPHDKGKPDRESRKALGISAFLLLAGALAVGIGEKCVPAHRPAHAMGVGRGAVSVYRREAGRPRILYLQAELSAHWRGSRAHHG